MLQKKLKLIYIVTQAEWGGAQRYIFDLASALKDEFDVTVAAGAGGSQELFQKCQEAGIRTHTFQKLVRKINPKKDLAAVRELAKFFKQEKPNIIHLNSSKAGVIGAMAKKSLQPTTYNLQPKLIYTAHGWVFNEPLSWWRKRFYMILERTACKIHDKVIVLSKADFDVAIKNKICAPEKMVIIPHGIKPIDFFSREEARKRLATTYNLQPTTLWIGIIANLYKTKGINYSIDAAQELSSQGLKPSFIIVGDGPERKNYELRVTDYGLQTFHLVGSIPDAARYLMAFDIFVLPSVKEGLPYAILEATQAGLPIIVTCVGAIPEMIENEKNGLLIKPKDSKMLREAIEKLLNDEGLRNKLGEETQKTFKEKFNFDAMIQKTLKVYTTDSRTT